MKKKLSRLTTPVLIFVLVFAISCQENKQEEAKTSTSSVPTDTTKIIAPARTKIISAEEQKNLTPNQVIERLKEGNKHYLANNLTVRDHSALVMDAVQGQFPMAVILSCMDSRVPVEDVYDCAAGDLFVCRVAGNVLNDDMLGSLEYGCKVSGAKLIVVMGHRYCGAVSSAIKNVKLGNISQLLTKMKPAIEMTKGFEGEKTVKNPGYVTEVAINNVKYVAGQISKKSPLLKAMVDKGDLKIVAAGYDLNNGAIIFFE